LREFLFRVDERDRAWPNIGQRCRSRQGNLSTAVELAAHQLGQFRQPNRHGLGILSDAARRESIAAPIST